MELYYWAIQFWMFKIMVGITFILIGMSIGEWHGKQKGWVMVEQCAKCAWCGDIDKCVMPPLYANGICPGFEEKNEAADS